MIAYNENRNIMKILFAMNLVPPYGYCPAERART